MPLNTIIITKNKARRKKIEHFIHSNMPFNIVEAFASPIEAYQCISQNSIDIIFTDVKNNNFYSLFQTARIDDVPVIIHIAFGDNTLSTDEISTFQMPAKAFSEGVFNKIIQKLLEKHTVSSKDASLINTPQNEKEDLSKNDKNPDALVDNSIFIRTNYSFTKIFYDDILFVKAMENFVQVVTVHETYTTLTSLKNMLAKLPPHIFKQVHRSYIVNFHKIQSMEKNVLKIDKYSLPIGAAFKEGILKLLLQKRIPKR